MGSKETRGSQSSKGNSRARAKTLDGSVLAAMPPGQVTEDHKFVAAIIYILLVAAFILYAIAIIVSKVQEREDPPVTSWIQDDKWQLPHIVFCENEGLSTYWLTFDSVSQSYSEDGEHPIQKNIQGNTTYDGCFALYTGGLVPLKDSNNKIELQVAFATKYFANATNLKRQIEFFYFDPSIDPWLFQEGGVDKYWDYQLGADYSLPINQIEDAWSSTIYMEKQIRQYLEGDDDITYPSSVSAVQLLNGDLSDLPNCLFTVSSIEATVEATDDAIWSSDDASWEYTDDELFPDDYPDDIFQDVTWWDDYIADDGSTGGSDLVDDGSTGGSDLVDDGSTGGSDLVDDGSTGGSDLVDDGSTGGSDLVDDGSTGGSDLVDDGGTGGSDLVDDGSTGGSDIVDDGILRHLSDCTVYVFTIDWSNGDAYPEDASWYLQTLSYEDVEDGQNGNYVQDSWSSGSDSTQSASFCVPDGEYYLVAEDSYNDGWNGGWVIVRDLDQTSHATATVSGEDGWGSYNYIILPSDGNATETVSEEEAAAECYETVLWVEENATEYTIQYMEVDIRVEQTITTYIAEVDPLNIYEILGVLGGFWSYVGMIFGLIFVTQDDSERVLANFLRCGDKEGNDTTPTASSELEMT